MQGAAASTAKSLQLFFCRRRNRSIDVRRGDTTMRKQLILPVLALTAGLVAGLGQTAHASYLDPGSGSYLFQMAVAGALGGFFTLREMYLRWRAARTRARQDRENG
jgi:hypothetical protein